MECTEQSQSRRFSELRPVFVRNSANEPQNIVWWEQIDGLKEGLTGQLTGGRPLVHHVCSSILSL